MDLTCPMGLCQRVIRNPHIAYNRTFHLYFLEAKFQLLGICCSQLWFITLLNPFWLVWRNSSSRQSQAELNFWPRRVLIVVQCHLKQFENLKLQIQGVPKIWVFGPTLIPIYRLKMVKTKNSHWAIQISQNQGPIFFQFSMKIIKSLCVIWIFFRYKWAQGQRSRGHSSG